MNSVHDISMPLAEEALSTHPSNARRTPMFLDIDGIRHDPSSSASASLVIILHAPSSIGVPILREIRRPIESDKPGTCKLRLVFKGGGPLRCEVPQGCFRISAQERSRPSSKSTSRDSHSEQAINVLPPIGRSNGRTQNGTSPRFVTSDSRHVRRAR